MREPFLRPFGLGIALAIGRRAEARSCRSGEEICHTNAASGAKNCASKSFAATHRGSSRTRGRGRSPLLVRRVLKHGSSGPLIDPHIVHLILDRERRICRIAPA